MTVLRKKNKKYYFSLEGVLVFTYSIFRSFMLENTPLGRSFIVFEDKSLLKVLYLIIEGISTCMLPIFNASSLFVHSVQPLEK